LEQVLLDLHTTIKLNYKRILVAAVDLFNFFVTSLLVYLHLFGAINFYYNILKYARTCFNFNSNAIILLGLFLLRNIISCSVPVLAAALTMVTLLIVILNTTFFRSSAVWSWCYINIYFGFFGHPEVYYFNITWHSVFISAVVSYYARRRIFGHAGMVFAMATIGILGFLGLGTSYCLLSGMDVDTRAYFYSSHNL
jgi:heme/copper-type cytochrome/quinol oxidase subunit 1